MADTAEIVTTMQDQYLDNLHKTQEGIVQVVSTWAEASQNLVPDVPSSPFSDQWPTTAEYVENSFRFADRLLTAQREFVIALLDAAGPALEEPKNGAASRSRKPAAKTAATAA